MANQVARTYRIFPTQTHTVESASKLFLAHCKASNLSPKTVDYYSARLKRFIECVGNAQLADVTPSHVRDFLTREREQNSATTAAHSYTTLSVFFAWAEREGFVHANPMHSIQKPKRERRIIQTLKPEQVEAMLATCGRDFAGVRDKALILVLFDCGLRASEAAELTLDAVDWDAQVFRVFGKGRKERLVPFGNAVRHALDAYLARRGELDHDYVFVNCYGEPADRNTIYRIVRERGMQAGITGVRLSPHTLRHTFAVTYLRNGGGVFDLQKVLGHESLEMSRKYAELADADVIAKHRKASPADALKSKTTGGRRRLR